MVHGFAKSDVSGLVGLVFNTRLEGCRRVCARARRGADGGLVAVGWWLALAKNSFRRSCVGENLVTVLWWLALARNHFSGVRLLVAASSQCVDGSLWSEISFRESFIGGSFVAAHWWLSLRPGICLRESCVAGSLVRVRWWFALARNQSSGVVCCWKLGRIALVARFGEKSFFESKFCWWQHRHSALVGRCGQK